MAKVSRPRIRMLKAETRRPRRRAKRKRARHRRRSRLARTSRRKRALRARQRSQSPLARRRWLPRSLRRSNSGPIIDGVWLVGTVCCRASVSIMKIRKGKSILFVTSPFLYTIPRISLGAMAYRSSMWSPPMRSWYMLVRSTVVSAFQKKKRQKRRSDASKNRTAPS